MLTHNSFIHHYRLALIWLVLTLLLAGCATAPVPTNPLPPTNSSIASGQPPSIPVPTAMPPAPPTAVPAPPTSIPEPTVGIIPPAPPTAVPEPPVPPAPPTTAPAPPTAAPLVPDDSNGSFSSAILFLRGGDLYAYERTGQEQLLAQGVRDFTATPDGRLLALVRQGELWVLARDRGTLQLLLSSTGGVIAEPSWAADGSALVYTTAPTPPPQLFDWATWTAWCRSSVVQVYTAEGSSTIGGGCNPAFAPDGKRIAYVTAPEASTDGGGVLGAVNTLRIVNRYGANGWNFAFARNDATSGAVVYAPAWSPGAQQLAFQRMLGYQALVDASITEMGNSYVGSDGVLGLGAGWLRAPQFSPDGTRMLITQYNPTDPRGWGGYEQWQTQVWQIGVRSEVFTPNGNLVVLASVQDRLERATAAAWEPNGQTVVVALPSGWSSDAPTNAPAFPDTGRADLWLWPPGSAPTTRIVQDVDYATPVLWLAGR